MLIKIGDFECTEVWDGVFYKKLSDYPNISDWEMRTLIEFIEYEKKYACSYRKGCVTEYVCHLSEWVYIIVIPTEAKSKVESYIPNALKDKIIYVENDCKDIWDWSEKVYGIVETVDNLPITEYNNAYRNHKELMP